MKVAVVLVLAKCSDKILWPKPTGGAKIFFHYPRFSSYSTTGESHGKKLKQEMNLAQGRKQKSWRNIVHWLLLMTSTTGFLAPLRDEHLLWSEITHTNHFLKKKITCGSTYKQFDVGIISIEVLFPRKL